MLEQIVPESRLLSVPTLGWGSGSRAMPLLQHSQMQLKQA